MAHSDATKTREGLVAELDRLRALLGSGIAVGEEPPPHSDMTGTAVRSLREAEERFHVCIENFLDCFGIFTAMRDADGQITDFRIDYLNRAACTNNGLPLERQLG